MALEDFDRDASVVVGEELLAAIRGNASPGSGKQAGSLEATAEEDSAVTQVEPHTAEDPGVAGSDAVSREIPVIEGFGALREIGRGGFSSVFEALEFEFERWVAVKVLDEAITDEAAVEDFERECRAMGGLSGHPNIVTVFSSAFTADRRPCIVMELFPHGNYLQILQRSGPLGLEHLLPVSVRVASALATAHNRGMVHGDVKPQNIFRSQYELAALGDFGIATLVSHRWGDQKTRMSLYYAAPEIIERGVAASSPFADQYSLAATIYTLATGSRPFEGDGSESTRQVLVRTLSEPPPRLGAEYPAALGELLHKAMSRRLQDRFRDLREFAEALVDIEAQLGLAPTAFRVGSDAGRYLGGVVDLSGSASRSREPFRDRSREPSHERSTGPVVATGPRTTGTGGFGVGGFGETLPQAGPAHTGDAAHPGGSVDVNLAATAVNETVVRPQRPVVSAPDSEADERSGRPKKWLWAGIGAGVLALLALVLVLVLGGGDDGSPEAVELPSDDSPPAESQPAGSQPADQQPADPQPADPQLVDSPPTTADGQDSWVPPAMSGVVVVAGPGSLAVQWDEPLEAVPSGALHRVQWAGPGQAFTPARESLVGAAYLGTEIDGLLGDDSYLVRVRLEAGEVAGPWTTVEGVPLPVGGIPGAPSSVEVEESSFRVLVVAWTEPSDDGGSAITEYIVEWSGPDSGDSVAVPASQSRYEFPAESLSAGADYSLDVWAVNEHGRGESVSIIASTPAMPVGVAFASNRDGGWSFYTMRYTLDGGFGEPTAVSSGSESVTPRSWSPDRVWVAADVRQGSSDWEIYAFNLMTDTRQQLTCNTQNDWGAAWSPDSTRVAFARLVGNRNHDLYVLDVATGEETRVTSGSEDDTSPSWSPDSRMIAFSRGAAPYRKIWTVGADGGSPRQITTDLRDHASPSWSLDGSLIAYASGYGPDRDIMVIAASGGDPRAVTTGSDHDDDPSWSPEGSSIVFARGLSGDRDIYSVNVSSGDAVPLLAGVSDDWSPAWSSDSRGEHVKPLGCQE